MKTLGIVLICVALLGCAHSDRSTLSPGASATQHDEDILTCVVKYPSPPPADGGALFHKTIKKMESVLAQNKIRHTTQGFLGNHFYITTDRERARALVQAVVDDSPFKVVFQRREGMPNQ